MLKKFFSLLLTGVPLLLAAQKSNDLTRSTGFPVFAPISNADIPGAPLLQQPVLITGTEQEIRTEKHGLAYPAFFDWNKDGKTDLLLGEFETGQTGSDIKVYLNTGTNKAPKYSGKYFYAKDTRGDTMTTYQWCCIGTHPRMVDINHDGYLDMLSGQYNPGKINLWLGSAQGFQPRTAVSQDGYIEGDALTMGGIVSETDPRSLQYWNYTSAGFADFNDDGLEDLFVGGFGELRVALNTGTKDTPNFGLRKYLRGVDGKPLSIVAPDSAAVKYAKEHYEFPHFAGVYKSFITPCDWDGDGVLDLLVTHLYGEATTKDPVVFFRGVKTDKGLRFENAKPLFTAKQMAKTFPGCQPNIAVRDYNNDGVMDLVIGLSLPTVNGFEIDTTIAWQYLHDVGIESPGKDAGRAIEWEGSLENVIKKVESDSGMRRYFMGRLKDYKYLTLRHRGYVYVMLGKKNPQKATAQKDVIAAEELAYPVNAVEQNSGGEGPVSVNVKSTAAINSFSKGEVEVTFNFQNDWYGYAETTGNLAGGWIPTKVDIEFPKGFVALGSQEKPPSHYKGASEVYSEDNVRFVQKFEVPYDRSENRLKKGEYPVKVHVQYQTCNSKLCLPPVSKTFDVMVKYL